MLVILVSVLVIVSKYDYGDADFGGIIGDGIADMDVFILNTKAKFIHQKVVFQLSYSVSHQLCVACILWLRLIQD